MNNFTELQLSARLQGNLAKHGFIEPTPVQAQSIEPALAGRDLVATAQTGTGKTLAFVLPMLHRLTERPQSRGVRPPVVVGGLGENAQLNSIRKGAQVVIATPGRLYDFLSRRLIDLSRVEMLVLDEADRMLDMGFLPTIE